MKAPEDFQKRTLFFYRQMLLIRRFEEKVAQMYGEGYVTGFCHLYIGQEAVATGAIGTLNPQDYVFASYREHPHPILKGTDPKRVMAELFGKKSGCSQGKGGSMHLFDVEKGFLGGHAIVAGHCPLAAGTAFASKYLGNGRVSLCFFGDGATNQGVFHETLNLAAMWELPVVFICENNRYGMGTAIERTTKIYDIAKKASGYAMPHEQVDGMDVEAVYQATKKAVERARQENTPTLLEAVTYRFKGHSMSDPAHYRTKEELEEQKERDPLRKIRDQLLVEKSVTEEDFKEMEKGVKGVLDEAVRFAMESEFPSYEDIFADVYA
ncbi:MAG: pyruvate dehydrogenase (acetyl-transferring) E1 component subunit alpha [Deltaproteobacteria bacterium]|nr:pyruvate dehydrogenase (acetyl-transferring) E1 component subunit alpha [Deltaproteobacteria bacterium]